MLSQTLRIYDLMDDSFASGASVVELFKPYPNVQVTVKTFTGAKGSTDFVQVKIPGTKGKTAGGSVPTLGIIGRLGGVGARPARIGLTSDGDGCIAALSAALKIADMSLKDDRLEGDVIVATHVCPRAPTLKHEPVDFMDSPVDMSVMNAEEVSPEMDAVLSIDTTKGNRIINHRGFALSPTVKKGWILHISEDLLRIMEMTTGELPVTFPITMQDITPYGNGVYHLNSILQPAVATDAPVVGVAITTVSMVPGCGTGASHEADIAETARFAVEVAKEYGRGTCSFFDKAEFERIESLYGSMKHLQTLGK